MTLPQARRRVWAYRLIGLAFVVVGSMAIILIFGKMAYLMLSGDMSFQIAPGVRPHRLIDPQNNPLQYALKTYPILAFIWSIIPMGNNQFFLFVIMSYMIWSLVGAGIIWRARNLSSRIRRAREAVEEERWRRSLGGVAGNIGTLSIQLESEDHWYAKPSGLLVIGLIIEVIGGLIVLLWGHLLFGP